MDDCIFCKIIKKQIPAYILWEDEDFLVFLDVFPNNFGQTLVIPKKHESYIFNLECQMYSDLMEVTKKISSALKPALDVERICVRIEGFEVPHTHVKLYPVSNVEDLDKETYKATEEELKKASLIIKKVL